MKHTTLVKRCGIKLTVLARAMNMSESLLRYHLNQKPVDSDVDARFRDAMEINLKMITKFLKGPTTNDYQEN